MKTGTFSLRYFPEKQNVKLTLKHFGFDVFKITLFQCKQYLIFNAPNGYFKVFIGNILR